MSCCSPTTCAPGRRRSPASCPASPRCSTKVAEGIAVEGMESLAPALVEGMESVLDVLPASTIVLLADPERIRRRAHDLVATSDEFLEASWANAAAGNQVPVDLQSLLGGASYWTLAQVRAHATAHDRSWWTLTPFAADAELVIEDDDVDERARRAHRRHGGLPRRHRARRRAPALPGRGRLARHRRHRGSGPRQARRGGAPRARGRRPVSLGRGRRRASRASSASRARRSGAASPTRVRGSRS